MNILGLDTSAVSCGAAVCRDGKIVSDVYINVGLTHSQTALCAVNSALENGSVSLDDVDALAVAAGPGSFTGIRIGVSAVKGMAFKRDIPVFGVSTLYALACGVRRKNCIICPVMDARCSQVYTALFEFDGEKTIRLTEDTPLKLDELEAKLGEYGKPVVFTGDGCRVAEKYFGNNEKYEFFSGVFAFQHGCNVALAAWLMYNNGEKPVSGKDLFPRYLRLSQAERERNRKGEDNK